MDELTQADRAVLTKLLDTCETQQSFVSAKRFRVDNFEFVSRIDELLSRRFIIEERDIYRVSVIAVVELDSDVARALMRQAELMWKAYQEQYRSHLDASIPLRVVADKCDLDINVARRTLTYMLEAPWSGGQSSSADRVYEAVTATEKVLKFETFRDCVVEMRSGHANPSPLTGSDFYTRPSEPSISGTSRQGRVAPMVLPSWLPQIPIPAQKLIDEIYLARSKDLFALPAMGIRAVVDVVSFDVLGEDLNSFASKLNELRKRGYLTQAQNSALSAVVEAGSAAAHRGFFPDEESIEMMLDALVHMLQSIYVLEKSARELSDKTPARKK